jgi:hypothetical protein
MKRTVMVFANLVLFLSLMLMPCFAQVRPTQISQGKGQIEGTVVTEQRTPIANAIVYLLENGRSPVTTTDSNGRFSFKEVPVGSHKIIAYKESDGFPNMIWSFYSEAYGNKGFRLISVTENQSTRNIFISLGPKAGRLLLSVIDAHTKRSIEDAEIALNYVGRPKTLMKSGTNRADGGFDILVPPSVRIEMVVNAPGYRAWPSNEDGSRRSSKIVSVNSGSETNITIELQAIRE